MKPFTDNDLKRLRSALAQTPGSYRDDMEALLVRLDAAEEALTFQCECAHKMLVPKCGDKLIRELAWRKASGKLESL